MKPVSLFLVLCLFSSSALVLAAEIFLYVSIARSINSRILRLLGDLLLSRFLVLLLGSVAYGSQRACTDIGSSAICLTSNLLGLIHVRRLRYLGLRHGVFLRRLSDRVRFVHAIGVSESAFALVGRAVGHSAVGVRVRLRDVAQVCVEET
ncbi:hypothetical protein KCV07_g165, partial [Aureobasidium melanogenum]